MDKLPSLGSPHGLHLRANHTVRLGICPRDRSRVVVTVILGVQQPLAVLLVLDTHFLELTVQCLRSPAVLLRNLGNRIRTGRGNVIVVDFHLRGGFLDLFRLDGDRLVLGGVVGLKLFQPFFSFFKGCLCDSKSTSHDFLRGYRRLWLRCSLR